MRAWVGKEIGSLAKPDEIRFTDSLPKTRSGKIMRRLLRELAAGGDVKGDVTTLEDLGVLAALRQDEEQGQPADAFRDEFAVFSAAGTYECLALPHCVGLGSILGGSGTRPTSLCSEKYAVLARTACRTLSQSTQKK